MAVRVLGRALVTVARLFGVSSGIELGGDVAVEMTLRVLLWGIIPVEVAVDVSFGALTAVTVPLGEDVTVGMTLRVLLGELVALPLVDTSGIMEAVEVVDSDIVHVGVPVSLAVVLLVGVVAGDFDSVNVLVFVAVRVDVRDIVAEGVNEALGVGAGS
eukprot:gb/GECG01014640.1/.p1 GENE.gb/GECG01014640.1/~~gb/GECG01014640.1/.p1  ORF type:complete len:158 (+),score=15.84 gb/GECG01014640.1/:1-474(+)